MTRDAEKLTQRRKDAKISFFSWRLGVSTMFERKIIRRTDDVPTHLLSQGVSAARQV